MKAVRFFYDRSPLLLQNFAISTYGHYIKRVRYGQIHRQRRDALDASQWLSAPEMERYQSVELSRVLTNAYQQVPYYRDLFTRRGLKPQDVGLHNFAEMLPTISKDLLRSSSNIFHARGMSRRSQIKINTSGTTGTPLTILATRSAVQTNYAFFSRFLSWAGVKMGQTNATFAGRSLIPRTQKAPPFWRRNAATNTTLFSSYHISDATIPAYVRALEEVGPAFIDAYPSAISTIAGFILERNVQHAIRPAAIITSSETLLESQRAIIEKAFGCPVFDHYGSAEMVAFITQCEKGRYHINPEYGIVEILREDGLAAEPGQAGELVCTGFLNNAMPLIRYRTGDRAVRGARRCDCGRDLPVVDAILGRMDEVVITREGRMIGRLDPIFKGLSGIRETQIVQEDLDHLVIRLVKGEGYSKQVGAKLAKELVARVGGGMQIRVEEMKEIPREASGKFRSVISHVRKPGLSAESPAPAPTVRSARTEWPA